MNDSNVWFTNAITRCPAVKTDSYRGPIQCTMDRHTGGHYSIYTKTSWPRVTDTEVATSWQRTADRLSTTEEFRRFGWMPAFILATFTQVG